jgi:hypothetical protein
MKMKRIVKILRLVVIIILLITISCDKKNTLSTDCDNLATGILNEDETAIKSEISILLEDLDPEPTADDKWGHKKNFGILIERLNQCEGIVAGELCYCCIYTLPPQSEIHIKVGSRGHEIQKILDFSITGDGSLVYSRMHGAND